MTTVTGLRALSKGASIPADAHGNNVAFICLNCGGPVLATLLAHQRGSSESKPTRCIACSSAYWVEPQIESNRLLIHRVRTSDSGRCVLGKEPKHTSGANAASWKVIAAILTAYGGGEYEDLIVAVRQHDHPDGGKAFVDYCIRNEWLRRT